MKIIEILIDLFFKNYPQSRPNSDKLIDLRLVAHRGAHATSNHIENTLPALDWCINNRIWGIEFDVRFTADNKAVIHHDAYTKRLFPSTNLDISNTTFSKLRSVVPDIPLLEEFVERATKSKIHLMIEIKETLTPEQNEILLEILSPLKPKENFHLLALNTKVFDSITFAKSNCFLPVTTIKTSKLLRFAIDNKCAGLSGHYLLLTNRIQQKLSDNDLKIGVGFANSQNSLFREVNRGCNWIFSDHVEELAKILPFS